MKKLPSRNEVMVPIIEAISQLGGSATQMKFMRKL
jgi:hypothetical protein